MSKDNQPPSIAVFADESGISKKLLMGLASFQREHEGWLLNLFPASTQAMRDALESQTYSGILILDYHPTAEDYGLLKASKIPGVLVGCDANDSYGHSLLIDPDAVASIAAKTLLDRGFRNIAFAGALAMGESQRRYDHFRRKLEAHGVNPLLFTSHAVPGQTSGPGASEAAPTRARLARWLESLEKPVGIFASDDRMAFEVHGACSRLGIAIPEEVALLGVNDDTLLCRITHPNLASIRLPYERMGYDAARTLRKLIRNGDIIQKAPLVYEPVGLIVRDSIKQVVVQDPVVRDALIYIQENCMRPVNVEDMLEALQVSRSLLERRFRDAIGVTPLVELRRQRIELARALLSDTQEPIQDLGARCGFSSAIRFTTVFKEQVGLTPSDFRKQMIPGSLN